MAEDRGWIVLLPGSRWTDNAGTDHQLALALAERHEILWVDPPHPFTARRVARGGPTTVTAGVHTVEPFTLPGASRVIVRDVARPLVGRQLARILRTQSITPLATIALSPRALFPTRDSGTRVLFVTDDWVAGASLMGLDRQWIERTLRVNIGRADRVAAITVQLADELSDLGAGTVEVVPNGTTMHTPRSGSSEREPVAGLVGQLNERLDLGILEAVADRGIAILVVGPLAARDGGVSERIKRFLNRTNVTWTGPVPQADLGGYLSRMSVGMTPYLDTAFNRASYPLKTLEYLGSGIPAVSTDLPAARDMDSEDIHIASGPAEFAAAVALLVAAGVDADGEQRCRVFAAGHSWRARAEQLLGLVDDGAGQRRERRRPLLG